MATDPIQALHEELPRQAAWVRRLARKLVRDESAAEDLAQDALLASLSARHPLRGALQPWLARVTANLARRGWRDEESRRRREHAAAITHSNLSEVVLAPDEVLGRLEIQGLLVEELKELPDPCGACSCGATSTAGRPRASDARAACRPRPCAGKCSAAWPSCARASIAAMRATGSAGGPRSSRWRAGVFPGRAQARPTDRSSTASYPESSR